MAPRKPKSKIKDAPEVPFDPPKVNKRVARKAGSTEKITATSVTEDPQNYQVKRYKNGLLNLENTPHHLVETVKRNATDSPLLRLPPEIRNAIWHFALSYDLVVVRKSPLKGGAIRFGFDRDLDDWSAYYIHEHRRYERVASAFHLPEVCRQIYSETALLAYRLSPFTFENMYGEHVSSVRRLKLVQKKAICSIEFSVQALEFCLRSKIYDEDKQCKPFKRVFPNLERIIISERIRHYAHTVWACAKPLQYVDHADWFTKTLQRQEGSDVVVEFRS